MYIFIIQVLQRRFDGSVDFNRFWVDYKDGFGDPEVELWLGNEKIYHLTNSADYQLRIDLVDPHGISYYAKYSRFRVANESDNYRLGILGNFSGTIGMYDYGVRSNYLEYIGDAYKIIMMCSTENIYLTKTRDPK